MILISRRFMSKFFFPHRQIFLTYYKQLRRLFCLLISRNKTYFCTCQLNVTHIKPNKTFFTKIRQTHLLTFQFLQFTVSLWFSMFRWWVRESENSETELTASTASSFVDINIVLDFYQNFFTLKEKLTRLYYGLFRPHDSSIILCESIQILCNKSTEFKKIFFAVWGNQFSLFWTNLRRKDFSSERDGLFPVLVSEIFRIKILHSLVRKSDGDHEITYSKATFDFVKNGPFVWSCECFICWVFPLQTSLFQHHRLMKSKLRWEVVSFLQRYLLR